MWIVALDRWLLSSAIFGTVVLLFGSLALLLIKQPVHRIRVIQWTLIACLFVPILQQFELLPGYSLALWKDSTEVAQFAKPLVANTVPTTDAKSSSFAPTAITSTRC